MCVQFDQQALCSADLSGPHLVEQPYPTSTSTVSRNKKGCWSLFHQQWRGHPSLLCRTFKPDWPQIPAGWLSGVCRRRGSRYRQESHQGYHVILHQLFNIWCWWDPQFSVAVTATLSEKRQPALNTGAAPFLSPEVAVKSQAVMTQGRLHSPSFGAQQLGEKTKQNCASYWFLNNLVSCVSHLCPAGEWVIPKLGGCKPQPPSCHLSAVGSCRHPSPTAAVSRIQAWDLLEVFTHSV